MIWEKLELKEVEVIFPGDFNSGIMQGEVILNFVCWDWRGLKSTGTPGWVQEKVLKK